MRKRGNRKQNNPGPKGPQTKRSCDKTMSPEKKKLIQETWGHIKNEKPDLARNSLLKVCVAQIDDPEDGVDVELIKLEAACTTLETLLYGPPEDKAALLELARKHRSKIDKPR